MLQTMPWQYASAPPQCKTRTRCVWRDSCVRSNLPLTMICCLKTELLAGPMHRMTTRTCWCPLLPHPSPPGARALTHVHLPCFDPFEIMQVEACRLRNNVLLACWAHVVVLACWCLKWSREPRAKSTVSGQHVLSYIGTDHSVTTHHFSQAPLFPVTQFPTWNVEKSENMITRGSIVRI